MQSDMKSDMQEETTVSKTSAIAYSIINSSMRCA